MRSTVIAASCLLTLLVPAVSFAAPSDTFWNPFRNGSPNISQETQAIIAHILATITSTVGRVGQLFVLPNPSRIGIQPRASYYPTVIGLKTGQLPTIAPGAVVPSPIHDTAHTDQACGGLAGEPYWANDCSCRCSTGAKGGVAYEVSDRCPENDNLTCEDCRTINRGDNTDATVAQCRDDF